VHGRRISRFSRRERAREEKAERDERGIKEGRGVLFFSALVACSLHLVKETEPLAGIDLPAPEEQAEQTLLLAGRLLCLRWNALKPTMSLYSSRLTMQ
jgi:hypothetical protein